jgi:hypothetical protein
MHNVETKYVLFIDFIFIEYLFRLLYAQNSCIYILFEVLVYFKDEFSHIQNSFTLPELKIEGRSLILIRPTFDEFQLYSCNLRVYILCIVMLLLFS